jgi:polyphenol oxidase
LETWETERLKKAYKALRDLTARDPNDPRGWLRQANVHCWYCGGPTGTQLPEIHGGWYFFPWHRAYLYFHELILGSLINDPTFALPYWDWDNDTRRRVPPPYNQPNDASNPLLDANRGAGPNDTIGDQYLSAADVARRLSTTSYRLFLGYAPAFANPNADHAGQIEDGPHGLVHIWTGDPTLQNAKQDMGVLATASQDPVFFAHHANVDRLWDVCVRRGNQQPVLTSWREQKFYFYNEKSQWMSILFGSTLAWGGIDQG